MNTTMKRMLSLVLCLVMLVGVVPVNAFAKGGKHNGHDGHKDEIPVETVAVETTQATVPETTEVIVPGTTAATVPEETVATVPETTEAAVTETTEATVPETTEATVPETTEETEPAETTVETQPALMMMVPKAGEKQPVDAAIFFSDLHTRSTDYKESTLKGIMSAIKNAGLPVSAVTSCGDAFSVNEDSGKYTGYTSTLTGYIQDVFDVPVNYVWSDHDRYALEEDDKTLLSNDSGFVYGAGADGTYGTDDDDNYYIYSLSMADLSTNNRYNADFHTDAEVNAAIAEFATDAVSLKQDRPLFIASHQPLLDRRNDNGYAYQWATAINAVAENMDVAFFFGHNHRYDVAEDYYYAKGETMSVCSDSSGNAKNVVLNFTHLCAGYMAPSSTGSTSNTTRQGVAVAVTVYEDAISYVTYDASGIYTGSYALNETVEREHAVAEEPVATLQSIAVTTAPAKTAYTVGETFDASSLVVTATYSDGTTSQVTDYTLSEVDMTTAGTKTVTVTYQGQTATFEITVAEAAPETGEPVADTNGTGITVAAPGVTEVAVTEIESPEYDTQVYAAYASYDITVQGHETGVAATVTLPAPENFDAEKPVLVLYAGEVIATTSIVDGMISFTTDHFSVYDVAQTAEGDLKWIHISDSDGAAYYELATSVESGATYLIASANSGSVRLLDKDGGRSSGVTVSNNRITSGGADYEWTFTASGSGYTIQDSDKQYLYPHAEYSNGIFGFGGGWEYSLVANGSSETAVNVSVNNGAATLSREFTSGYSNKTAYLRYSSGFGASDSISNLYLFKKVTQPGGSVYAAMEGQTSFRVQVTNYDENIIRNAISVYTASDANGTGKAPTNEYQLVGTVNGSATGTYELSVQYGGKELGKLTVVVASDPYLKITHDGEEKELVYEKEVAVGDTVQLGIAAFNGTETETNPVVTWTIPEEYAGIAEVDSTGKVTFKVDRANFLVKASWTVAGKELTDTIQIIITPDTYLTPGTSTNDFPEYPNDGAIRYDKTAEAVGNFSETGVTQMELSMTGIPYSAPKKLDVVLMLDHSNSMTDTRMAATRAAVEVFVNNVVKTNGQFNGNRIYIGSFAGGNPDYAGQSRHEFRINKMTTNEEDGYQIVNDQDELDALIANVNTVFVKPTNPPYGTEYDQSLEDCYNILNASKPDGNQQFCVFMSDGIPNVYRYGAGEDDITTSSSAMANLFASSGNTKYAIRGTNYKYEYWSSLMKQEGVTVFTVGLGLNGTNSSLSGATAAECERVSNMLLNDISGPAGETAADRDTGNAVSKLNKYFFSVADANAAEDMENVFTNIASQIMQAATDIVVTDKIASEYHMIFGVPKTKGDDPDAQKRNDAVAAALANQDLYIEVVNYTLDSNHERTDAYDTLTRIYLKDSNGTAAGGTYSAATDAVGTAAPAPTFTAAAEGKRGYWSQLTGTAGENDIVIPVNGTTWKFMEKGDGTHNVTAGAYAYGTIDAKTNRSEDLVIVTPYFAYSAKTKMLAWTADKVEEFKELALRYFLYLDDSSTEIGTDLETAPGSYPTNEWAYITYTNHLGNDCRREFPKPQMTWNGAQVSYVFYLVNEKGEPINKAGTVVDFANATFITDVFTEAVVWNDTDTPEADVNGEGVAYLDAKWKAQEKLYEGYTLYDPEAYYELKVYEDHEGNVLDDYFMIDGSEENGDAESTTKVYNTKAGTKYSAYGKYNEDNVASGFDFANTTVAFAVVWKLQLNPDTVVVDYGLDVLVNVVENDLMSNTLTGISKTERNNLKMNTAIAGSAAFTSQTLDYPDYVFSVEGENQIRFHQKNMQFDAPETIYYESKSTDYIGGTARTGYMYSSLTIIPATTVYYEDSFVSLSSYSKHEDGTFTRDESSQWTIDGNTITSVQQQDRPGPVEISEALDADNNYGYDAAYKTMSQYSMGSAAKINVDGSTRGEATFTFYGTGFDVIGLTSNASGTLIVQLYNGASATGTAVKSLVVDTFYGYTKNADGEWEVSLNNPNALYQVPVMKMSGLAYGQYTVKIVAGYNSHFDNVEESSDYDLYLDAIRIYDPTGNQNDVANDAYVKDGEGWPKYEELRNKVITAETFETDFYTKADIDAFEVDVTYYTRDEEGNYTEVKSEYEEGTQYYTKGTDVEGVVFIDCADETAVVADYTSYGPNNELYLAAGQAIAFDMNATAVGNSSVVKIQLAVKTVGNTGEIEVYGVNADGTTVPCLSETISTATDMYYDITALNGKTVVIKNTGDRSDAILSLTNVKVTYTEAQSANADTGKLFSVRRSSINRALATMSVEEDTIPETSEPVVVEPETTEPDVPETETTIPETSEPEATEPEETKPQYDREQVEEAVKEVVQTVVNTVVNTLKNLFSRWFR